MENSNIFEELTRTINANTANFINSAVDGLALTLGTITSTGLKVDNLKQELNNYMILDYLKLNDSYSKKEVISNESHSHTISQGTCSNDTHSHNFIPPKELKPIKPGDRVLVAQLGSDFIVIGRVSNA